MWRLLLIVLLLFAGTPATPAIAQDMEDRPVDLAAMLVLPDDRYQFIRGGYLTRDGVRYLIEQRYATLSRAMRSTACSPARAGYRAIPGPMVCSLIVPTGAATLSSR